MDLSRVANDRKLYLCKWYFKGKNPLNFETNPENDSHKERNL